MSTEYALVGLDLNIDQPATLADKIRRAGQTRALLDFVKDLDGLVRADLEAEAKADTDRAGGGGFTRKVDGVQATVTDPKPKPHVTDPDAFEQWWVDAGLEHETRDRVEAHDHELATHYLAGILGAAAEEDDPEIEDPEVNWRSLARMLADCLDHRTEYVLPEKPLDRLTEAGRAVATDNGLIDTETGEAVPGVECSRAAAQLRVTPDKEAKARDRALVASYFGLPAQLPSGSDR